MPWSMDLWADIPEVSEEEKQLCEARAFEKVLGYDSYISYYWDLWNRYDTVFDLKRRKWHEIPAEERAELGRIRAESHNHLIQHTATMQENKEILKEYVHFLHLNHVHPIFVAAPMSAEYSQNIPWEMKESVRELLDSVPEEISYVDLNQFDCFDHFDFLDTDHLNMDGARKMSEILIQLFGK